jgi:hypothetical protein
MVNRHHTNLVILERLVVLARRRFAMLPVGVSFMEISRVFRRMMRLRLYMLRSAHVRALALERLLACRRACEFRTGTASRWGKCAYLGSLFVGFKFVRFVGGWDRMPLMVDVNGGLVQADTRTDMPQPPRRDDVDWSAQRMRPPSLE